MKKILIFSIATVTILSFASCQKEGVSASGNADTVTATLTVTAPAQLASKAVGDGQVAENLVFAVFDETGAELADLRQGDWIKGQAELKFDDSAKPQVKVTTTLVRGKEYTFVCWAQSKDVTCYDFKNMKAIEVDYTVNVEAQNERRDAFYAAVKSGKVTDDFTQDITLRRPFAQINVGTSDVQAAYLAGLEVNNLYSVMTVNNVATVLNTFDGSVSGNTTVNYTIAPSVSKANWDGTEAKLGHEWLTVNTTGYEGKSYGWLAMNYVLVNDGDVNGTGSVTGAEQTTTSVAFTVYEGGVNLPLCTYTVNNVPVQRNYRSHILGDVLTAQGTLTVIIEPDFLNPDHVKEF